MPRIPLLLLILCLVGCTEKRPTQKVQSPAAQSLAHQEPVPPLGAPAAVSPPENRSLPDSIPIDASSTIQFPGDKAPVTVTLRGGQPVPWTRTELTLDPLAFDAAVVTGKANVADCWEPREDRPAAVRICCTISGLPADALFVELDAKASEVTWADGSHGTLREIWSQYLTTDASSLDFLTTAPPADPSILAVRIALDVHQSQRVMRSEASIAIDEAASFDFGVVGMKWTLSSDLRVTGFTVGQHRKALIPLLDRGLYASRLVRLADANGRKVIEWGGGGAGSISITHWAAGDSAIAPPVRVTVDVPQETKTSRVLLPLKDIHPRRQ